MSSAQQPAPWPSRGYRDLIVWQRAMQLVVECDRLCGLLDAERRRAVLRDQLFRAAISVPANIAEGHGRLSRGDNVRHLAIARGSLQEVETLLSIAEFIAALSTQEIEKATGFADEVGRMLTTLIRKHGTRRLSSP